MRRGLSACSLPQTRRSMVFARHLRAVGDRFRSQYLNSTDEADGTPVQDDWTKMQVAAGLATVCGRMSSRSLYGGSGGVGVTVPLGVTSLTQSASP